MTMGERPDADAVRAYLQAYGITQTRAARLCRVDPRTFRRYVDPGPGGLRIPYCVWYTLADKTERGRS